ncbi:hypothetical protein L596_009543 [Steinernema carpocapsae]|uniref:Uncharacterized protein n=1 Tax=Steinernema carpocapsae TaxID=34508 RepID=A0A4U5PGZ1_STECR|nr:hypothetical protein L596_009543 [Steinernema carpocapsae]
MFAHAYFVFSTSWLSITSTPPRLNPPEIPRIHKSANLLISNRLVCNRQQPTSSICRKRAYFGQALVIRRTYLLL